MKLSLPIRPALAAFAAAAILAAPLTAQMNFEKPGKRDVKLVSSGKYTVDHYHTMVGWRIDHMGFTPYFGIFGDVTGSLELDVDDLRESKLDITIPVAKITTASAELSQHLMRAPAEAGGKPEFFGPNPADAHFVMTSLSADKRAGKATMTGNLTLNGFTKPVTLDIEFYGAGKLPQPMGGGEGLGFTATGTIKRSDFGLSFGIPMVGDKVELDIAAGFIKQPG